MSQSNTNSPDSVATPKSWARFFSKMQENPADSKYAIMRLNEDTFKYLRMRRWQGDCWEAGNYSVDPSDIILVNKKKPIKKPAKPKRKPVEVTKVVLPKINVKEHRQEKKLVEHVHRTPRKKRKNREKRGRILEYFVKQELIFDPDRRSTASELRRAHRAYFRKHLPDLPYVQGGKLLTAILRKRGCVERTCRPGEWDAASEPRPTCTWIGVGLVNPAPRKESEWSPTTGSRQWYKKKTAEAVQGIISHLEFHEDAIISSKTLSEIWQHRCINLEAKKVGQRPPTMLYRTLKELGCTRFRTRKYSKDGQLEHYWQGLGEHKP